MSTEIEQAAREMGWRPKEEFRGDESKWVDADTFVSRGEHFIPIIKADRDKARAEAADLRASVAETQRLLTEARDAIEGLKEYQTAETKRQVEQARKDVARQLKEARDLGDTESEIALLDQLVELREAKAAAPAPAPKPAAAPAAPAEDPVFTAWKEANPWFATNPRQRGLAMGIAEELRAKHPTLIGAKFFEKITEEMQEYLSPEGRPASKVSGGRPTPGAAGSGERKRSFADLPAEAKEACNRQAKRLVGPGRAFKDDAAWQAHYVEQYFIQE